MRAVIYARYSSDNQREASIEDQIEICRRYIDRQGWTLVRTYQDRALSGASDQRPAYQQMLADAEAKQFDVVVSEALDRLGRRLSDVARLYDHLEFRGVRLHAVNIGQVTTMHVGLLGTMAQLYLSDLKEKTRRGQLGRALAGKIPGGKAYGYRLVEGERGERKVMKLKRWWSGASSVNLPPANPRARSLRRSMPKVSRAQTVDSGAIRPSEVKSTEAQASSTTASMWVGSNGTAAPTSRIRRPGSVWPAQIRKTVGRSLRFPNSALSTTISGSAVKLRQRELVLRDPA